MANDQIRSGRLGKRREPSHMQTGTPAALQKARVRHAGRRTAAEVPKAPMRIALATTQGELWTQTDPSATYTKLGKRCTTLPRLSHATTHSTLQ